MAMVGRTAAFCLAGAALAQQVGKLKEEAHPKISLTTCTKAGGCKQQDRMLTMDAQWRWLHTSQSGNCIMGNTWAVDAESCGSCQMEGIDEQDYEKTYGVSSVGGGIKLKYVNGPSIGSRLYMMDTENKYMMFKLLNREFSFDVDVSALECGLNGAVYLVEMDVHGGLGTGENKAGAKYGTGYCDAQCPHDLKFIEGKCNIKDWHITPTGPIGHFGSCCSEMDLWEANAFATAYTAHPCETIGPQRCEGGEHLNACGDTPDHCECCDTPETCTCCGRYEGLCDKDGCDYNSYRLGNTSFFGRGPQFSVDTSKPVTVVTQFLTSDGTDTGDLTEIRRLYVQGGKVIKNSATTNLGEKGGDSITDDVCKAQKAAFNNPDDFARKGGLRAMGRALGRGMVLVLSLWDDALTRMVWLDSAMPAHKSSSTPGVQRGPCSKSEGNPPELRSQFPDAFVTYTQITVGEINTTYGANRVAATVPPTAAPGKVAEVVTHAAGAQGTAVGPYMVTAPGAIAPGKVAPGVAAGAARTGKPTCCSSAKSADRCGSCWPGSELTQGACASEAGCAGCGGRWCPDGVFFAEAWQAWEMEKDGELPPLAASRSPFAMGGAVSGLAILVVVGAVSARVRLLRTPVGESCRHEVLSSESQLADA